MSNNELDNRMSRASKTQRNKELDFFDFIEILLRHKLLIFLITLTFLSIGISYILMTPKVYRSEALLIPNSSSGSSGLSGIASQFGGIASIAGINLGGSDESNVEIALALTPTWGFQEKLIRENNLAPKIIAVKGWDALNNKLLYDESIFDSTANKWRGEYQSTPPSSWELYEESKEMINIIKRKDSGLVSISVEHYSPEIARDWVFLIVELLNSEIQEYDKKRAKESIKYLTQKATETNIAEMQTIFYQLIEEHTKTLLLTEVNNDYVFRIVSEPKIAEKHFKPNYLLVLILSLLFGFLLSICIALFKHASLRK
ncbi:MAG: hypothetical protein HWE11_06220 [Gammaproteobacteria bacterium]|nr:hypothetical protein [Gammaproteobacteria bacterium]